MNRLGHCRIVIGTFLIGLFNLFHTGIMAQESPLPTLDQVAGDPFLVELIGQDQIDRFREQLERFEGENRRSRRTGRGNADNL